MKARESCCGMQTNQVEIPYKCVSAWFVCTGEIIQIHLFYKILSKVTATLTDNGSNLLKAFKMYQLVDTRRGWRWIYWHNRGPLQWTWWSFFFLPPHQRCASHSVNLITTNDVEKWLLASPDTRAIYRSGIAKCVVQHSGPRPGTPLWHQSLQRMWIVENLMVPTSIWWNSFYEVVSRITEISIIDWNASCIKMGIKGFTNKEYQFLRAYCVVIKPLTLALDFGS